jgi:hypothetical protein
MKNKLVLTLIALVLAVSARAQEHTAEGVAAGAVVGGVIGNQYRHNVVGGAVAGALIGGIIGNAVDHANDQPKVAVLQAPPPPLAPVPVVVQAPPPVPVTIQYVWGPLDHWGHPQYVYVQEWNGTQWVATYYNYRIFLGWYQHRYGYVFREDMYRHHWHR